MCALYEMERNEQMFRYQIRFDYLIGFKMYANNAQSAGVQFQLKFFVYSVCVSAFDVQLSVGSLSTRCDLSMEYGIQFTINLK